MNDLELKELLSLADDRHEPPEGFRDELLAALLVEVRRPPAEPAPGSILDPVSSEASGDHRDTDLEPVSEYVMPSIDEHRKRHRRRWVRAAGAGAAAAILVVVAVTSGSNGELVETGPVPADQPTTEPVRPDPAAPDPADLFPPTDSELCEELSELASGFLGNERTDLSADQLGRLSALLTESDARALIAADPSEAIDALAYAQLTADQNADDAAAAHERARSAMLELRLDLDCSNA